MNVYDFDGTIYDGDSTVDFYLYCLRKHPRLVVYAFRQGAGILLQAAGHIDADSMKEQFFSFLNGLRDTETLVNSFWDRRRGNIGEWYLRQRERTDVVISASPEFLLRPICETLGITPPIATRMDLGTGRIEGRNCKGKEKVRKFLERYPQGKIRRFYSDSLTDAPLAAMAEEAFLIKKGASFPWPNG